MHATIQLICIPDFLRDGIDPGVTVEVLDGIDPGVTVEVFEIKCWGGPARGIHFNTVWRIASLLLQ